MSTQIDSSRDELRALRERAYGPDADIQDDPVALARLRELEEQAAPASAAHVAASARSATNGGAARPSRDDDATDPGAATSDATTGTVAAPGADPTGHDGDGFDSPARAGERPAVATESGSRSEAGPQRADGGADSTTDVPADTDPSDAAEDEPLRPWWRRVPLLWAASVVVAMLVGAASTLGIQALEAGRVGVLQVDPDAEWPEDVWGGPTDQALAFETFYGLSVLSQPQVMGDATQGPVPCLIVFSGVSENPSYLGGSCGAGSFPAQASLIVGRRAPDQLLDRFPAGTALLFVLDGEQVNVYAREPDVVEPTP